MSDILDPDPHPLPPASDVIARLRAHAPVSAPACGARRAAVLAPLRPCRADPDALEVVLTRRTHSLPSHGGQVSFPGGGIEPADPSPEHAALREAREELGIPDVAVELLGRLDDLVTVTGYHVVPVVGMIPADLQLVPDPREVARCFSVPLAELCQPERWRRQAHQYGGREVWSWHFPHDGEDVWGATARMLRTLLAVLKAA